MSLFGKIIGTVGRVVGGAANIATGGVSGTITGLVTSLVGRDGKQVIPGRCPPGSFPSATGQCTVAIAGRGFQDPRDIVSPSPGFGRPAGEAVMGRFGAALQPFGEAREVAVCLPGMVLGIDNLCYNKRDLKNSERKWPRGRRPLLTGGDMRAISTASAAAKKLQATTKRLQSMGMLKKPAVRRAASPKLIGPGTKGVSVVNVD